MPASLDHASPAAAGRIRSPLGELLFIALPTVAQMASYTVAQFIDTFMLSHVNDAQATAAGMAGLVSFTVISFGFGVMMLVNALVSQSAGRGDLRSCGQYMWQGIWSALLLGAICLPVAFGGERIFLALGHTAQNAAMEGQFFLITVAFAAVKLVGMALEQFLLAVQRPRAVLLAAVAGVCCMIPFNYAFIYGRFGAPRLGVVGAAWGLNLAVTVEAVIIALIVAFSAVGRTHFCGDWRPRWHKFRSLILTGFPSGVQVATEVAAWALFLNWVIGGPWFGEPVKAANNYMFRYMSVSFMPAFGLSVAVTALVGRYIGMGKPDIAMARAHLGFKVGAVYMVLCGVFFFVARRQLIGVFSIDPAVIEAGSTLLVLAGVYQFFDAMYIVYNGALRGAGDTFVPACVVGTLCWSITVGGGYLMARFVPQLGVLGPWLAAATYGVLVGSFLMFRFTRGKWQAIRLEKPEGSINLADSRLAEG